MEYGQYFSGPWMDGCETEADSPCGSCVVEMTVTMRSPAGEADPDNQ